MTCARGNWHTQHIAVPFKFDTRIAKPPMPSFSLHLAHTTLFFLISRMPPTSAAAAVAAAAIITAITALFLRRRRTSSPPPPPPTPCPPPAPLLLVVGHRLARTHLHALPGCVFSRKLDQHFVVLLSASLAAAFDERVRQRWRTPAASTAASAAASLMHSYSTPSRSSTQHTRLVSDYLPDAPPPVISAATRAYVAELQNKCYPCTLPV